MSVRHENSPKLHAEALILALPFVSAGKANSSEEQKSCCFPMTFVMQKVISVKDSIPNEIVGEEPGQKEKA